MLNALTIDVEDWYSTLDFNFPVEAWGGFEDRIEYSLKALTDVLGRNRVKATFFVLADIAKRHRALIRSLVDQGHEVGSHGTYHRLVYSQDEREFRSDLLYSKDTLEDITGRKVELFRAASWSISRKTLWALNVLEEEGFACDSSVQPFRTPLSGVSGAPLYPYNPVVNGERLNLVEFPPTVANLGRFVLPFAGGLYLRVFSLSLIKFFFREVNKTRAGMLYIHPWEVDTGQPRLSVRPFVKFSHYHNLDNNLEKFERLVTSFDFLPMGQLVKDRDFPALRV